MTLFVRIVKVKTTILAFGAIVVIFGRIVTVSIDGKRSPMSETPPEETSNEMSTGDLDPRIWDNPTLGKQNLPFLDQVEAQAIEDQAAVIEDRTPREVVVDNDYPGAIEEHFRGTPPSDYTGLDFVSMEGSSIEPTGDENEGGFEPAADSSSGDSSGSSDESGQTSEDPESSGTASG